VGGLALPWGAENFLAALGAHGGFVGDHGDVGTLGVGDVGHAADAGDVEGGDADSAAIGFGGGEGGIDVVHGDVEAPMVLVCLVEKLLLGRLARFFWRVQSWNGWGCGWARILEEEGERAGGVEKGGGGTPDVEQGMSNVQGWRAERWSGGEEHPMSNKECPMSKGGGRSGGSNRRRLAEAPLRGWEGLGPGTVWATG